MPSWIPLVLQLVGAGCGVLVSLVTLLIATVKLLHAIVELVDKVKKARKKERKDKHVSGPHRSKRLRKSPRAQSPTNDLDDAAEGNPGADQKE